MTETLLLAPRMFDGTDWVAPAALWLADGRVRFAGSPEDLPEDGRAAPLALAEDVTLLPGLIDLHMHCMGTVAYSFDAFLGTDERLAALRMVPRLAGMLAAGYTSVRDVGSGAGIAIAQALSEGLIAGPRVMPARAAISQTGGHVDHHGVPVDWLARSALFRLADGPDDCRRAVREQARAGAELIKICTTGGILSARDHPDQTQFTPDETVALVDEAHRLGLRVAVHAQGTEGINQALRAGADTIEHGIYLDDESIERLVEQGATLVPTLAIVHQLCEHGDTFGVPPHAVDKARRARDAHHDSLRRAVAAGVRIGAGSDFMGGPGNRLEEAALEIELLVGAGLTPTAALAAATSVAADALSRRGLPVRRNLPVGWEEEVGRLAPGLRGDVVVVRGDPREDISAVRRVCAVFQDGEQVAGSLEA